MKEVIDIYDQYGMPVEISFDHDLGENEPTGYDITKWLCEKVLDGDRMFLWYVHSMNGIGKKNIEEYLKNIERVING